MLQDRQYWRDAAVAHGAARDVRIKALSKPKDPQVAGKAFEAGASELRAFFDSAEQGGAALLLLQAAGMRIIIATARGKKGERTDYFLNATGFHMQSVDEASGMAAHAMNIDPVAALRVYVKCGQRFSSGHQGTNDPAHFLPFICAMLDYIARIAPRLAA